MTPSVQSIRMRTWGIASGSAMRDKARRTKRQRQTPCPPSSARPAEPSSARPSSRRRHARSATDERQYVLPSGQKWTTLDALKRRHFNCYREYEPGLIGIGSTPPFAIGQRALLVRTPARQPAVGLHRAPRRGDGRDRQGARRPDRDRDLAPALLHAPWWNGAAPSAMSPIHLHAADQQWIMRPDPGGQALGRRYA